MCLRIEATSGVNSNAPVSTDWGFTALKFNVVVIPGCFGRWDAPFLVFHNKIHKQRGSNRTQNDLLSLLRGPF